MEHYSFELPTSAIVKITNATCLQAKEFNANVKDPAQKAETIVAQMDGSMVPIVQYSDASQEQRLAGLKKNEIATGEKFDFAVQASPKTD